MGCGQEQHHSLYSWQETNSEVSYNRKLQKATSLRGQQFQKGYVDKPCGILYVAKAASFIIINFYLKMLLLIILGNLVVDRSLFWDGEL